MSDFSTSALRWQALTSRNPLAQDAFIYSVITTKIYCRPTCPSRLARRANIIFHNSSEQAEREGFRACMRCKPGTLKGEELDPQIIAVGKAKALLRNEGEDKKWNVKTLAKEVGLTESHLCRVFKKIEGVTIGEYRVKLKEAKELRLSSVVNEVESRDWVDPLGFELELPRYTYETPTQLDNCEFPQHWDHYSNATSSNHFLQQFSAVFDHIDLENAEELTPELSSTSNSAYSTEDCLQFLDFDSQLSNLHEK